MKILIIRTIQAELIKELVGKWKLKFPVAKFDILTHHGQPNIEGVNRIITYDTHGDFSWKGLSKHLRNSLKEYDVIIFPHKWNSIKGFDNVIELAIKLSPKIIYHSDKTGKLIKVSKLNLIKVWLHNILTIMGVILIIPLCAILLRISLWRTYPKN